MKNKFYRVLIASITTVFLTTGLCGCNTASSTSISDSQNQTIVNQNDTTDNEDATNSANIDNLGELTEKDLLTDYDSNDVTTITFSNSEIKADDNSVNISGNTATITKKGDYIITGTTSDGQLIIDSDKEKDVHLILDNASITSKSSAPIYVKSADKVIITLKDGTNNYLSDSKDFAYDNATDKEPNATLFSKDSITINGEGELTVNANFNNGIQSKDHLKILSGKITVTSKNDAIKGKDSVTITGGEISISATGDGLDSDNSEEDECGYVHITNGKLNIKSEGKGIKAASLIYVEGGTIDITSTDDAINSSSDVQVDGGTISIDTKDDAIHGDLNIIINDGSINIINSYEGLESENIIVNEGTVNISATDDGINVAGASSDTQSRSPMASDSNCSLTINGGYVYINCEGDGLDSNGTVVMNDGTAIIEGPSYSANGALDYGISFTINGGILIAMGTSMMAENVSESSTQCSALLSFSGNLNGAMISITDTNDNLIISYTSSKTWGSITFSTPEMTMGETYNVCANGTLINSTNIGSTAYIDGVLTDGELLGTYTQDSTVCGTGSGMSGGGPGGGMGGGPGKPGGGHGGGPR